MTALKRDTTQEGDYSFEKLTLNFSSVVQFDGDRCSLLYCIGTTDRDSHKRFSAESQSVVSYAVCRLAASNSSAYLHEFGRFTPVWQRHLVNVLAAEVVAGWTDSYNRIAGSEMMSDKDRSDLEQRVRDAQTGNCMQKYSLEEARVFAHTDGAHAQPCHVDTNEALTDTGVNDTLLFVIPLLGEAPSTHIPLCPFVKKDASGLEWRPWSIVTGGQCPVAFPTPRSPCLPLGRVPVGGIIVTSPATVHNGALPAPLRDTHTAEVKIEAPPTSPEARLLRKPSAELAGPSTMTTGQGETNTTEISRAELRPTTAGDDVPDARSRLPRGRLLQGPRARLPSANSAFRSLRENQRAMRETRHVTMETESEQLAGPEDAVRT